jgi:hypothetical protein
MVTARAHPDATAMVTWLRDQKVSGRQRDGKLGCNSS